MENKVIVTPNFISEAKKLLKKYQSLKDELLILENELSKTPALGTKIGENIYKIRLAVKSKGKGKSGGMRIITYLYIPLNEEFSVVYLLSIYDKSEFENIKDSTLQNLVKEVEQEFLLLKAEIEPLPPTQEDTPPPKESL